MTRAAILAQRHAGLADAIGDFEQGRRQALQFLDELRAGTADGDALFYALRRAQTCPAHELGVGNGS